MKLRIADRILVALAGVLLIGSCAGLIAQMFFGVDLVGAAARVFSSESPRTRAALIALTVFLLLLGIYCLLVLFRHRRRRDKFILQRNESGELAISLKALENMVQKCLDQHNEIQIQNLRMENQKDGLLIRLRGSVAGGISIPLTVESLQRQIKQYVTACSGVEVKGIRVQIESTDRDAEGAPFTIEGPAPKPLLKEENDGQKAIPPAEEPSTEEKPVPQKPATEPAPEPQPAEPAAAPQQKPEAAPAAPEMEDDGRPLHQRLFKPMPEPCIVPAPPEDLPPDQTEDSIPEAAAADMAEMTSFPTTEADETPTEEAGSLPETEEPEKDVTVTGETLHPEEEIRKETTEGASAEAQRKPEGDFGMFTDFDTFVTGNRAKEEI